MSAARIAARLRERLPEGWAVTVSDGAYPDVRVLRPNGLCAGGADSSTRKVWATSTRFEGRGWPERLADALADSLLGFGR